MALSVVAQRALMHLRQLRAAYIAKEALKRTDYYLLAPLHELPGLLPQADEEDIEADEADTDRM